MATITIAGLPAKTGTIDSAAYLHLSESGVDKKITITQLLTKISGSYSTDINTFLASADNEEGRNNLGVDRRTAVDNVDYTILTTDRVVSQTGTMSAARTFSLPPAANFKDGGELIIIDESGTVNPTNKITVQRNGADTIDGETSIDILQAYGVLKLICDGANSWKIANRLIATQAEVDAWTNSLKVVTPETLANRQIPAFRAYLSAATQSISNSIWTKVQLDAESFDTNSWFDSTTNYRFTPQKAGYYRISMTTFFSSLTNRYTLAIYKNGVNASNVSINATGDSGATHTDIVYLNGSTDYIEFYVYHLSSGAKNINGASEQTWMAGELIA